MTLLSDAALARLRAGAAATDAAAPGAPDLTGTRYELRGLLGRGGAGSVHRVWDRVLQREVALKVLEAAGAPGDDVRLFGEARVLAALEHPAIVPLHDAGRLPDGRAYCTMKLVRGERLDAWAAGAHPTAERLGLLRRLCEAVAFAHAHGVVHRDLTPRNVMVGAFGEVLVMDFGVALRAGAPAEDGVIAGTPGFMAPEQERGAAGGLDGRVDVYALGALLRFLLRADGGGEVPAPLRAIAARACAADPAGRYPDALELADDLGRFLAGEAVRAHRETPLAAARRLARRHRVPLLLVLGYVLVRVALALAGS